MPTVSAAQHRLMEAAAHTKGGYGGVPQSVGKEFVGQDAPRSIAAGILFVAPDGDVLLLRRAIGEPNYGGHWALPGGKADGEETAEQAADREVMEEIGESPRGENVLCDVVNTPNGFEFHTFLRAVPEKFVPELNEEHAGFVWTPPDDLPEPVHPGVARVIKALLRASKKVKIAADSADWNENEHPRAPDGKFGNGGGGSSSKETDAGEMPDIPDFLKAKPGKKPSSSTSSGQKLLMPQFGLTPTPWQSHQANHGFKSIERGPMPKSTGKPQEKGSIVVFAPGQAGPKELNGVAFAPWAPPENWSDVDGQADIDEPEAPELPEGKTMSSGVVIREPDGRVWVMRPKGGFGGYDQTFPKGGVEEGLSMQANAIKEAWEETGLKVKITGFAGDHEGDTTVSRYYLAERVGGDPADAGDESEGVILAPPDKLGDLLNRKRDKAIASGLTAKEQKEIDPKTLKKVGAKMGSNEGGTFEDPDGNKFYVKKPQSKAHVANELAAARLYQLAGVNTLDYRPVAGGEHVATALEKLDKKNVSDLTPAERKEAAKDFMVHAWLGNYDAAGTGGDNQGVLNGKVTTLDVGGSLRYRAQGAPKGDQFGPKVREVETMRGKDPKVHAPDAAALFGKMTDSELRESAKRVTSIPDEAIRKTVGDDKALADILIARKNDLASRFGEAKKEPKPMAKDGWSLVGLGRPFGRPIPGPGAARGAISPAMAYDRAFMAGTRVERAGLAFDRATASVRHTDRDGRLHVSLTHISKATVNPYLGNEIPRFEELGLVPDKVYLLLRDPDELRKGAATFNNIPLLSDHVAVTAADHKPEHVIGSTGTDAVFDAPYLDNSLVIWAKRGIEYVESKKKKELSCAYHYRADMTPGVFEGKRYDGVMRDLVGNHVALVEEGRAGSDVVVGDSVNPKIKELLMSKQVRLSHMGSVARGALLAFLAPRLAMDAKINLVGALKGVTAKNFKETRPALEAALIKAVTPKLAQDASIDGLKEMLDMLEGTKVAEDAEAPKAAMNGEEDDDESETETETAADNDMEDDDDGMAGDEDEDEAAMAAAEAAKKKKAAKDKKAKDKAAKDAEVATASEKEAEKKAMDARIKLAADEAIKTERQTQQAIAEAREKVRPWVGNLPMAFDSVGGLYRKALTMMGKDVSKVKDDSALPYILEALPRPDSSVGSRPTVAMDSAASKSFAERFPGAASIRNV